MSLLHTAHALYMVLATTQIRVRHVPGYPGTGCTLGDRWPLLGLLYRVLSLDATAGEKMHACDV